MFFIISLAIKIITIIIIIIITSRSFKGFPGGAFLKAECRALLPMAVASLHHRKMQRMWNPSVKNLIPQADISG
jgi:hypothetical protein